MKEIKPDKSIKECNKNNPFEQIKEDQPLELYKKILKENKIPYTYLGGRLFINDEDKIKATNVLK
jgi:hypothetical protein